MRARMLCRGAALAVAALLCACAPAPAPQSAEEAMWRHASGALSDGSQGRNGGVRVIEIHQTACQFLEAERYVDQNFDAASAEACNQLNAESWGRRSVEGGRPLLAMQGPFIIRVTNVDVGRPVDFWLRPYQNHFTAAQPEIALPEYRIAAIAPGETKEITVDLPRSFYVWSSPENGTPDYSLLVYDPAAHW